MLRKKTSLANTPSKLQSTLSSLAEGQGEPLKPGLVRKTKQSHLKTKSYRLRDSDVDALRNITNYVNQKDDRMIYSDSQVVRGIINYIAHNMDSKYKTLIPYIKSSS